MFHMSTCISVSRKADLERRGTIIIQSLDGREKENAPGAHIPIRDPYRARVDVSNAHGNAGKGVSSTGRHFPD